LLFARTLNFSTIGASSTRLLEFRSCKAKSSCSGEGNGEFGNGEFGNGSAVTVEQARIAVMAEAMYMIGVGCWYQG
jgi:hypothetical protein